MKRFVLVLAVAALVSCSASADMVATFVPVTSEGTATPPDGFVTSDLSVTTTADWLAANMLLSLSSGSIYQDSILVGIGPPSSALVSALPSVRWDTYVTGSAGLAGGSPSSAGGAVDLGGTPLGTFSESAIDLNWFTTTTNDIGTFTIGRFTLSDDAVGTFELRLDFLGQSAPLILSGAIQNGSFTAVPEAGTLAMSAVGVVCVVGMVRRRRQGTQA